jgi:hypothetical protein
MRLIRQNSLVPLSGKAAESQGVSCTAAFPYKNELGGGGFQMT